jgi:hypothetical protein
MTVPDAAGVSAKRRPDAARDRDTRSANRGGPQGTVLV